MIRRVHKSDRLMCVFSLLLSLAFLDPFLATGPEPHASATTEPLPTSVTCCAPYAANPLGPGIGLFVIKPPLHRLNQMILTVSHCRIECGNMLARTAHQTRITQFQAAQQSKRVNRKRRSCTKGMTKIPLMRQEDIQRPLSITLRRLHFLILRQSQCVHVFFSSTGRIINTLPYVTHAAISLSNLLCFCASTTHGCSSKCASSSATNTSTPVPAKP